MISKISKKSIKKSYYLYLNFSQNNSKIDIPNQ